MMRVVDDRPGFRQATWQDVHVMVWAAPIGAETLSRSRVVGAELAREYPDGFLALNVIANGLEIPDLEVQLESAALVAHLDAALRAVSIVLPGDGPWVTAARAFMSGVSALAPGARKRRIVANVPEGARWLAERAGRSPEWAFGLAHELVRHRLISV